MIRKIKWKNHKVLGNLELDFTKNDGSVYNTIVLAGENGSGKTTVLESISKYLTLEVSPNVEYWEYETVTGKFRISPLDGEENLCFHRRINLETNAVETIRRDRANNPDALKMDKSDIRAYGCLYSKSRSGFNTRPVKSTTTEKLDSSKYDSDSNEDFTSIKQLIVDVHTQDTYDYFQKNSNGESISMSDFQKNSKMYRFKKAFHHFFYGAMKFSKIDRARNEMQILFEKYGKSITIDGLSTGEKQIIFRGSMLLKNSNVMENGCILIDEPELSMHPSWQSKILDYYRDLFRDTSNKQSAQMIFATHSEYVIRSAIEEPNDIVVVVLKNNGTDIETNKIVAPQVLPTITAAEINYIAFNIASSDYHILLYGYLQEKTGCTSIKNCDNYIIQQPEYDSNKHEKTYTYRCTTYKALPTYIRNCIDHPDRQHHFTNDELVTSIELLQTLCKAVETHENLPEQLEEV